MSISPPSLIMKKRDGGELSDGEIRVWVDGFVSGSIPDYQMSAMAMAILFRGMSTRETATLTQAMLESGTRLRPVSDRPRVDKHSTGGIGDKVSLVLAPMLAACGADVPMISGRGLGHTGGTLDKLESIPGFQCEIPPETRDHVLSQVGCVIVGADQSIAPADRRLYALRDVTATVESIPLITASILAKKLAESLDALVMDVKVGSGAFMRSIADARELSNSLIRVGSAAGLPTCAVISDMNQPLGSAIGNAVEVNEALDALDGNTNHVVTELSVRLSTPLLIQVGLASDESDARKKLRRSIENGVAMERFLQMVAAQGGSFSAKSPRLSLATVHEFYAMESGYVMEIDGRRLGELVRDLGGGRATINDQIDPTVGLTVRVAIGDKVERGDLLGYVYTNDERAPNYATLASAAFRVDSTVRPKRPLVQESFDFSPPK